MTDSKRTYRCDYSYLRPKLAETWREQLESVQWSDGPLEVRSFKNAMIYPDRKLENAGQYGCSGVVDENGFLIRDSINGPYEVPDRIEAEAEASYSKKAVYLGAIWGHWGHFLMDATRRMWYCMEENDADTYVFTWAEDKEPSLKGNIKEFMELLGIADKVEIVTVPTRYKEVVVPEMSVKRNYESHSLFISPEFMRPFDAVVAGALGDEASRGTVGGSPVPGDGTGKPQTKIFLSRTQYDKYTKIKREIGVEMLDDFFRRNGFEVVSPEELSLTELIRRFSTAEVVASQSGTVNFNVLFAPRDAENIVLNRLPFVDLCSVVLDAVWGGRSVYIDNCLTIYPTAMGRGPFFSAYTKEFERFVYENGYMPPDRRYTRTLYKLWCFSKYSQAYRRRFRRKAGPLEEKETEKHFFSYPLYIEAYQDSFSEMKGILNSSNNAAYLMKAALKMVKQYFRSVVRRTSR